MSEKKSVQIPVIQDHRQYPELDPPKVTQPQLRVKRVIERGTRHVFNTNDKIVCHEINGVVRCNFPKSAEDVTYSVDNFQSFEVYEEHMSECLITFFDGQIVDVCQPSLQAALAEYDKFVYSMLVLDKGLFDD